MCDEEQTATEKINNFSVFGLPNPIDTNIGKKITSRRCTQSFSRQAFAELLCIPESLLERIEHGKEKIPVALLWYVAALLETDIKYFFEDIIPDLNPRMFVIPEPVPLFLTDNCKNFGKRIKRRRHKLS